MTGAAAAAFDSIARRNAVERLQANRTRLTELGKQLRVDLAEARKIPNAEDYSADGLERLIAQRQATVRRKLGEQVAQLKAQIDGDVDMVRRQADATRPKLGNDALALQRAQMKWDQVRMRLEAGMSIQQVLSTADADTALALREWGPAWIEVQAFGARSDLDGYLPYQAPDTTALMRSIDARLAEISGTGAAETLTALRDAEVVQAGASPVLAYLEQVANGSDTDGGGLTAAIESSLATREATAYYAGQAAADTAGKGLQESTSSAATGGDAA